MNLQSSEIIKDYFNMEKETGKTLAMMERLLTFEGFDVH